MRLRTSLAHCLLTATRVAEGLAGPGPLRRPPALGGTVLVSLVVGQLGIHAAMAGLRMAAPLQALREGYSAWAVGLLLALFAAAPVVTAMPAGRLADRHGYHRPVYLAVALAAVGTLMAVASTFVDGFWHFALLCLAAMATGTGANTGMLAIQRTAGMSASDPTERVRVFSWLGVAPSLSNVVGPLVAGVAIDLAGFAAAYSAMAVLTLLTLATARRVPPLASPGRPAEGAPASVWSLLHAPGMKRLMLANWLLSTSWDVHTFAVPIIGHERGFSASTIGAVLATFTLTVSLVRLAIPAVAHRMRETTVIGVSMVGTGVLFAVYPLAQTPWQMAACAAVLGLFLGSTQPMILSTLHHLTPDNRHGESLAFRSMAINLSSTVMPLVFGAAGVAVGAAALFWVVGTAVGLGGLSARRLPPPRPPRT